MRLRIRNLIQTSDYESACLGMTARLGEALDFAHGRGILHLDVKPANILIDRYGRPKLSDLNVARAAGLSDVAKQIWGGTGPI